MNYHEIIDNNVRRFRSEWPKYAFHMAGIDNVVKILSSGRIFSRCKAKELGVMSSDNASKGVIDHTDERVKDYVRFYFRPKTPTYYYFEGYHQAGLRFNNDDSVNISVPVLLLFDLDLLLLDENTCFNGIKASGNNFIPARGIEAFNSLQFDRIYSFGAKKDWESNFDYRQAEILYPDSYLINKSLKKIVCRNQNEAITLGSALAYESKDAYYEWQPKIIADSKMFSWSGLYIQPVNSNSYTKENDLRIIPFKIKGHDAYYRFISKYVTNNSGLLDYPPMKIMFDVRFKNNPYHHLYTSHIDLKKSDIATGIDNIPKESGDLVLKVFIDDEKNLVFFGRYKDMHKWSKFKIILDASDAMPPFPECKKVNEYNAAGFTAVETDELPF